MDDEIKNLLLKVMVAILNTMVTVGINIAIIGVVLMSVCNGIDEQMCVQAHDTGDVITIIGLSLTGFAIGVYSFFLFLIIFNH